MYLMYVYVPVNIAAYLYMHAYHATMSLLYMYTLWCIILYYSYHTLHPLHLSHVVGNVEIHVDTDYQLHQVLGETDVLMYNGQVEGPEEDDMTTHTRLQNNTLLLRLQTVSNSGGCVRSSSWLFS